MSWGGDAIQFLPLLPGRANEQIEGLIQHWAGGEAEPVLHRAAWGGQAPLQLLGLFHILGGTFVVLSPSPSPPLRSSHPVNVESGRILLDQGAKPIALPLLAALLLFFFYQIFMFFFFISHAQDGHPLHPELVACCCPARSWPTPLVLGLNPRPHTG